MLRRTGHRLSQSQLSRKENGAGITACDIAAIAMLDDDEFVGVRIGQRPEQDRVHDPEHRDVAADAERQRQDRGQREPGIAVEQPERVAKIVDEHREHLRGREAPAVKEEEDQTEPRAFPFAASAVAVQVMCGRIEHFVAQRRREKRSKSAAEA